MAKHSSSGAGGEGSEGELVVEERDRWGCGSVVESLLLCLRPWFNPQCWGKQWAGAVYGKEEDQKVSVFFPLILIFVLLLQTMLSATSKNLNIIFQEYSSSNKCSVCSALLETSLLDRAMEDLCLYPFLSFLPSFLLLLFLKTGSAFVALLAWYPLQSSRVSSNLWQCFYLPFPQAELIGRCYHAFSLHI